MRQRRSQLLALSIILAVALGPGLAHQLWIAWHTRQSDRRIDQLQETTTVLQTEQQRLQHDPVYLEGVIRSTFKVSKPNEVVVPLDRDSRGR